MCDHVNKFAYESQNLSTDSSTTTLICLPLWATSHVGLVVNIVPGDHVVEACGGGSSNGEDESPLKGFSEQLQDFLPLVTRWQVGSTGGAAVPHPRVRVLRL